MLGEVPRTRPAVVIPALPHLSEANPGGDAFHAYPLGMLGRDLREMNGTFVVIMDPATPTGTYTLLLVPCYRNPDPENTTLLFVRCDLPL